MLLQESARAGRENNGPSGPSINDPQHEDKSDAKAEESEARQREEAAKIIQAVQRGKAARAGVAEEKQQREEAAKKIQAVQRGKQARSAAEQKKQGTAEEKDEALQLAEEDPAMGQMPAESPDTRRMLWVG